MVLSEDAVYIYLSSLECTTAVTGSLWPFYSTSKTPSRLYFLITESWPEAMISSLNLPNSAIETAPDSHTLILLISSPEYVSNILTYPSVDAVRISWVSGLKLTAVICLFPSLKRRRGCFDSESHRIAVASVDPLSEYRPQLDTLTEVTLPLCPFTVFAILLNFWF